MKAPAKPIRATQTALAKRLHVSRQAINSWKDLDGAPKGYDYDEWRAFISAKGLGVVGNRVSERRETLLEQLNERKLRLADLEIARKEGRVVLRSDMDSLHHAIFTRQKAVLFAALESEYPGKVVGRTAAEIRVVGRQLAERICDIFQQDVANWQWTPNTTKM